MPPIATKFCSAAKRCYVPIRGRVAVTAEAAAAEAAPKKSVTACVNTLAASAACWIAYPHYLRQAIAAKAYGSPCGLIVYLNINEFGICQAETEHVIEAANGCSRELSCSLALLLKPLPIVGASCGERWDWA
jgi:hypothetical protein